MWLAVEKCPFFKRCEVMFANFIRYSLHGSYFQHLLNLERLFSFCTCCQDANFRQCVWGELLTHGAYIDHESYCRRGRPHLIWWTLSNTYFLSSDLTHYESQLMICRSPWTTVFIEKPLVAQLVNRVLVFYRSVYKNPPLHLTDPEMNKYSPAQSTSFSQIYFRSPHLNLGFRKL